jgi:hypothetical protein
MKNIQAQYQDLLEGKMSKQNFMRNVRMQFPQHLSPTTSFDDSVKILKGKRILSEAKKPEGVYGHNPNAEMDEYRRIDHLNYYQVYHGIQFELAKMPEITDEAYIKARKKVVDTILKDPDAYKDLQLANFKAVKEMDKDLEMKDVKKNNLNDKPNEMKVVKKDVKGNTQDTLEKKEKKKSKTAKIPVMTQTPKGKLEAFSTPGKEKVVALKEHILDELTHPNYEHEHINKGSRVKKKGLKDYDEAQVGNVTDFDGDTATVKWDNGSIEHVQINVLTKKDLPSPKNTGAADKLPDLGKAGQQWASGQVKKEEAVPEKTVEETPKHKIIAQLLGPDFFLSKKPENQWDEKDHDLFNRLSKMAQETGKIPKLQTEESKEETKEEKIKRVKEGILKALEKEGYAITTQGGTTISTGKNSAQGVTAARDLERSTGDQLTVVDTRTGRKQQA